MPPPPNTPVLHLAPSPPGPTRSHQTISSLKHLSLYIKISWYHIYFETSFIILCNHKSWFFIFHHHFHVLIWQIYLVYLTLQGWIFAFADIFWFCNWIINNHYNPQLIQFTQHIKWVWASDIPSPTHPPKSGLPDTSAIALCPQFYELIKYKLNITNTITYTNLLPNTLT